MTKCDYIRYARLVQHLEINIIHHINRLKIKKSYDFINRYRKSISQETTTKPVYEKLSAS